jgi:hypothetical protein
MRVARLVVVALGYNSLWEHRRRRYAFWAKRFDHEALHLVHTLHRLGAQQIVWVTLRQPTRRVVPASGQRELRQYSWYFPYVNERLRHLDHRQDVVLADWRAVSNRRGLTYDSIHLNPRGAVLMAQTIKQTLEDEASAQLPVQVRADDPRVPIKREPRDRRPLLA